MTMTPSTPPTHAHLASALGRMLHAINGDYREEMREMRDVLALPQPVIVNCTGLGAKALFNDAESTPIKGQLTILLPQPEIRYAFTGGDGYMFPRSDGIILGGTFELDEWDTTPQPEAIANILASHQQLNARLRCTN